MALADALDRGALVLTANLRAARALVAAHAEDQRSLGMSAWPMARLLDWNTWIAELWQQYARRAGASSIAGLRFADTPLPLTALQEHQLWKQVQGEDRDRVVAPERMAELAQDAYGLLGSYGAHSLRGAAASGAFGEVHEDAERFLAWAASFDRLCEQHGWVSRTRLEEMLGAGASLLGAVPEIVLVGFDRRTPAQAALLKALEHRGVRISIHAGEAAKPAARLVAAKDPRAELEACAWWCREQLTHLSPQVRGIPRIAVIGPDLEQVRAELDRVFRRILMPGTTLWRVDAVPSAAIGFGLASLPGAETAPIDPPMPYEFSLGSRLSDVPVVRAALLILRWLQVPLSAPELTWLLTSGFLAASPADQSSLARLDAELRRSKHSAPEVSLASLLGRAGSGRLPGGLRGRLERLQSRALSESFGMDGSRREPSGRGRSFAHWSELVPTLLDESGWPGHRAVDSYTYQAQQRWTRLLGEVAALGLDGSHPSWSEFVRILDTQAHTVIFAAESTSAPIVVLGAFESSGQSFDAVWFLGADDQHWPPAGRPHPLLPAWLQREAGMPHASPDADWRLAQEATTRIVASAPRVVLSYAMQENAVALRASPLILAATADHARGTPEIALPDTLMLAQVSLESCADESGVLAWPAHQGAGGAEVLKRQAACAFQSFATSRLQARPLEEAEAGLNARDRGSRLHEVLERLWSEQPGAPGRLHSRDDLLRAIENGSVTATVTDQIDAVFAPLLAQAAGDAWNQAYLTCEKNRVHERLLDWLNCERERRPFAVAAIEPELHDVRVGALHLSMRPDRVDQLADGTYLLIDYKTGKFTTSAWDGERPSEPQLPLYAVFGGVERVSGVAFAQIRADETRLLARAEAAVAQVSEALAPVARPDHFDHAVRDRWQHTLLALADQFLRGEAEVNPRDGATTCRYCKLVSLCRVHATSALLDEGDDDAGEGISFE